jgi:mRNA-degrading endonuclease toxin of MazEF toxin-antitoxin module
VADVDPGDTRSDRPTRSEVLEVRYLVTVAEVTISPRGLAVEVPVGEGVGLGEPSVVNCDGLCTLAQTSLTKRLGVLDPVAMTRVCVATS